MQVFHVPPNVTLAGLPRLCKSFFAHVQLDDHKVLNRKASLICVHRGEKAQPDGVVAACSSEKGFCQRWSRENIINWCKNFQGPLPTLLASAAKAACFFWFSVLARMQPLPLHALWNSVFAV